MTAIELFSNSEEIVKELWSNFQHVDADAFTLSETLSLQEAVSAKDLLQAQTPQLNIFGMQ